MLNWLGSTSNFADRIGDWNPQLLRELKGRLNPRSVLAVVALALLAQLLLILYFRDLMPDVSVMRDHYSQYCIADQNPSHQTYQLCTFNELGKITLNWQAWWFDILRVINWGLLVLLMVPGVYLLVADLAQEEQRGTLNFIRLSPQTSRSILIGKLLGTPILVYLAVLLWLPLHLIAGIRANVSAAFLPSYYGLVILGCGFLYSAALLCGFVGKQLTARQGSSSLAFVGAMLAGFGFLPLYLFLNLFLGWHEFARYFGMSPMMRFEWFFLPIGKNVIAAHAFTIANLGLLTSWIWQSLDRCFHMPTATFLSKQQSYRMVAYLEVLLLGFCLQHWEVYGLMPIGDAGIYSRLITPLIYINFVVFLVLTAVLVTDRQTLQDWARYRHQQRSRDKGKRSLLKDLLWAEKSPVLGAIGLNLLIVAAVFVPWICFWSGSDPAGARIAALLQMAITLSLIALYAAIVQWMMLLKTSRRSVWALGILALALGVPSVVGYVLWNNGSNVAGGSLLLFSPLFVIPVNPFSSFLSLVPLALVGQWLTIGVLTMQIARQIDRLGESASKQLLASEGRLRRR